MHSFVEYKVWFYWRSLRYCWILPAPSQAHVVLCVKVTFPWCKILSVTALETAVQ